MLSTEEVVVAIQFGDSENELLISVIFEIQNSNNTVYWVIFNSVDLSLSLKISFWAFKKIKFSVILLYTSDRSHQANQYLINLIIIKYYYLINEKNESQKCELFSKKCITNWQSQL